MCDLLLHLYKDGYIYSQFNLSLILILIAVYLIYKYYKILIKNWIFIIVKVWFISAFISYIVMVGPYFIIHYCKWYKLTPIETKKITQLLTQEELKQREYLLSILDGSEGIIVFFGFPFSLLYATAIVVLLLVSGMLYTRIRKPFDKDSLS